MNIGLVFHVIGLNFYAVSILLCYLYYWSSYCFSFQSFWRDRITCDLQNEKYEVRSLMGLPW